MIEIYLLEQLAAFAKYGTLSRAAAELHISQPALSRSMKKLESTLGITLFIRDSKKIFLNETGKLAAQLAQSQVNQNKEMISRIIAFDRSLHSICVGSCTPMGITQLMPILQDCFGDMIISSELVYGEPLFNGLENGAYQIGILNAPSDDTNIFCQRYINEHLYISVPTTHRLANKKSVKFADLDGEKFLLFQHIGFWREICEKYMKNTSFIVQPDRDSFFELVENTEYPAFSSDAVLMTEHPPIERVYIPIDEEKARYTYYVACLNQNKHRYSSFFNAIRSAVIK